MLTEKYRNIVIFDLETSGLDFKKDQPIEIGAIKLVDGKKVMEKSIFIKLNNGGKLDSKIVELTHITDEMLQEYGVSEQEAVQQMLDIIGNSPDVLFIAHNAQFDLTFLKEMFNRHGIDFNIGDGIYALDTLTVYKDRAPYPHRLENAIEYYGITNANNSHRAIEDVKALHKVLGHMARQEDDLEQYINLFGYHAKYGISGEKLANINYVAQPYKSYKKLYEE